MAKMEKKIRSVDITFSDLKYTVDSAKIGAKKDVLKSISGTFKSGELTAIMGPSGAGKSSLMNILTGFVKSGVNGTVSFGSTAKTRKVCCYILQDDHFFPWFTVEEAMILAATLKISNNSMNLKEKHMLIEHLLDLLNLTGAKQTKCAKLSGGQKKRLSIALELIDNPPVLFLDEPTTGLDSSSSMDTITLLDKLACEGRTIVCTIHQPSSTVYNMFKHIYVLDKGKCAYQGSPQNTVKYLRHLGLTCPEYHNPADYLLEVVSGEYGNFSKELYESAQNKAWRYEAIDDVENMNSVQLVKMNEAAESIQRRWPSIESTKHIYPPPEWVKLWLLIGRCHVQFFRDWTVTYLKLAMHIMCAVLIGLLYGDSGSNATKAISNVGLFIFGIAYLWYTTMMPGILRFPLEIETIKKETFNNWYKLKTYYLATLITSTPVHIIFSSAFSTIMYLMTDQPFELERFVKFVLTLITTTITADGFGVLLGTVLDPINGTFVGAVLTCFMVIYSGFLILFTHMSSIMRAVSYTSAHRYALESMILSVYDNGRADMQCPQDVMYCHFKSADIILKNLGMSEANYGFNVAMLFLQLVAFKCLAYFTLRRKLFSQ
ncbi:ATP-binding cassette sub-family G member 1-like [Eupeodes corollae]|uniref:ATP-binding cassette sub-family G member 1-like n=1 Tax=Eupeodes corollae TaxID=290404 RepID=UPI00249253A1|nr:ATP-binding cassette sub-family G member 1-like [Eupeodes corollae]